VVALDEYPEIDIRLAVGIALCDAAEQNDSSDIGKFVFEVLLCNPDGCLESGLGDSEDRIVGGGETTSVDMDASSIAVVGCFDETVRGKRIDRLTRGALAHRCESCKLANREIDLRIIG
jgi:hypothetical protein